MPPDWRYQKSQAYCDFTCGLRRRPTISAVLISRSNVDLEVSGVSVLSNPGGRMVCSFFLAGPVLWDRSSRRAGAGDLAHLHPGIKRRFRRFESPDAAFLLDKIFAGDADKIML